MTTNFLKLLLSLEHAQGSNRPFSIYLQVNDDDPFRVDGLTLSQNLEFMRK